uniref:Transcriptional regulatory protein RXT2 N-terminal domain-containing protein n=1 Tax=Candidozyma auris TaxID=498019 RepID=A0A0L0P5S1_CANAR
MLDSRSLDIIADFKSAILSEAIDESNPPNITSLNRGRKLAVPSQKNLTLSSKIVEYDGSPRLVLTNENLERSNLQNKRRWLNFYGQDHSSQSGIVDSYSGSDEDVTSQSEDDDLDKNPFKQLRIDESLAPINHPSELATHPAVSKTYKLTCLPRMASDLILLIETEQTTLNHLNKLLRVLNGEDWYYILEEHLGLPDYDHGLDDQSAPQQPKKRDYSSSNTDHKGSVELPDKANVSSMMIGDESERLNEDPFFSLPDSLARYETLQKRQLDESTANSDELETLQQDLINYLQLSIQRQQEYINNLTSIRNGIVKVDRYRYDLYRWGKEMGERKN